MALPNVPTAMPDADFQAYLGHLDAAKALSDKYGFNGTGCY